MERWIGNTNRLLKEKHVLIIVRMWRKDMSAKYVLWKNINWMFEVFKIYIIRNIMDMSRVYVDVNKLNDLIIIFDVFIKLNIEYMLADW